MIKEIQRITGTVKWYDDEKGFGFIAPDNNGRDVFLHRSALNVDDDEFITSGERLTFAIQKKEKGPAAVEVKRIPLEEESFEEFSYTKKILKVNGSQRSNQVSSGMKFADLELHPELLNAVRDAGYEEPTPIQAQAIPIVLKGKDLLGCAQTGTGKTAAYALPTLQRLTNHANVQIPSKNGKKSTKKPTKRKIKALVVAPTRELAVQIKDSFGTYGKYTKLRSTVVYGGVGQNPQVKKLQQGVDILVATPGRLLDLMRQGFISLSYIEVLILDEGDRMLDMGFIPDIRTIVEHMPKKNRQTLLFSATIPREVITLAKDILHKPVDINISPEQPTLEIIDQMVFFVSKKKKQALLERILKDKKVTRALVFMRTKHSVNRVVRDLKRMGVRAEPIHGDKSQSARQQALKNFRKGKTRVLVATDVASRGIDVDDISHVIQFDIPDTPETYLHRIGRTARAGAGGTALMLCTQKDRQMLKQIEKLIRMKLNIIKNPFSNF